MELNVRIKTLKRTLCVCVCCNLIFIRQSHEVKNRKHINISTPKQTWNVLKCDTIIINNRQWNLALFVGWKLSFSLFYCNIEIVELGSILCVGAYMLLKAIICWEYVVIDVFVFWYIWRGDRWQKVMVNWLLYSESIAWVISFRFFVETKFSSFRDVDTKVIFNNFDSFVGCQQCVRDRLLK